MNASIITLICVVGVLFIKIFSWYIDKPRRIREIQSRIEKLEDELRVALIYNKTVDISRLYGELARLRSQLDSYSK